MTTPILNTVLVRCSNPYQGEITVGDFKLFVDPSFQPEWYRKISAEVVAVPRKLDTRHYAYRGLELGEIEVGDTIYFHYLGLTKENRLDTEDQDLYAIPYHEIFCKVREGVISALNGWALVEPVEVKSGSAWIGTDSEKISTQEGILRFIGQPKTDQPALNVKAGDRVVFSKNADFINTIEDKEYFVMQQEDLLATQPQKANEIESDYAGPRHYYETSPFYLSPDHD